jgi:hypothetical protein
MSITGARHLKDAVPRPVPGSRPVGAARGVALQSQPAATPALAFQWEHGRGRRRAQVRSLIYLG